MGRRAMIRPATEADLPGILSIYNAVIRNSTAVYADDPVTLEERAAWFAARRA
jgi:L-amino acid N-acyltransferase